jgi:hypothetical protein
LSDIFREIDEDLRRDRALRIWKRYGNLIIGAAVLLVLATGGYVAWQRYEQEHRQGLSQAYDAALSVEQSDPKAALAQLQALSADAGKSYGMLARFQVAGLKAEQGDAAGARADYDALAKDSGIGKLFRDAATILYAVHALDSDDPKAVIERLQPLTAAENPWRHSALELSGLAAQRAGDVARAREIFTALADDQQAPQALRGRAAEILAALPG